MQKYIIITLIMTLTSLQSYANTPLLPSVEAGHVVNFEVFIDGKKVCRYSNDKSRVDTLSSCELGSLSNASKIKVKGKLKRAGKNVSFKQTWNLIDVSNITHPLTRHDLSFQERLSAFIENHRSLKRTHRNALEKYLINEGHEALDDIDSFFPLPISRAAIARSEVDSLLAKVQAEFGGKLPEGLPDILHFNYSFRQFVLLSPDSMYKGNMLSDILIEGWSLEELNDILPERVYELYKRSLAIASEEGSMESILWDPLGGKGFGEPGTIAIASPEDIQDTGGFEISDETNGAIISVDSHTFDRLEFWYENNGLMPLQEVFLVSLYEYVFEVIVDAFYEAGIYGKASKKENVLKIDSSNHNTPLNLRIYADGYLAFSFGAMPGEPS